MDPLPDLLGRSPGIHMIVSDVGWALWAAIRRAISRITLNFEAYGAARCRRAEAVMDSPESPRWLAAVRKSLPGGPA